MIPNIHFLTFCFQLYEYRLATFKGDNVNSLLNKQPMIPSTNEISIIFYHIVIKTHSQLHQENCSCRTTFKLDSCIKSVVLYLFCTI